jgi:hypothetical protein
VDHLSTAALVPGPDSGSGPLFRFDDLAGLCQRLEQIPVLAGECTSEHDLDAVCEAEAQILRSLAAMRARSVGDVASKAEILVARLTGEGADAELCSGEAALLRSMLRDLRALARSA